MASKHSVVENNKQADKLVNAKKQSLASVDPSVSYILHARVEQGGASLEPVLMKSTLPILPALQRPSQGAALEAAFHRCS